MKPEVELIGQDGNAFFIIGMVMKALKRAGLDHKEYVKKAAACGSYDSLLSLTAEYVDIV